MRSVQPIRLVVDAVAVAATATLLAFGFAAICRRRRVRQPDEPVAVAAAASPAWLRRFVTTRFNPTVERLGLVGGRRSPWAFIEHVGRRSGAVFRAPVLPIVRGDHVYVPLPYGTDVHWARNVRAAGHCRLQRHEMVFELDEPAVITAAEHPGVPAWSRDRLERRGRRYLRLHVLSSAPGRLTDARSTTSAEPAREPAPEATAAPTPA